MAQRRHGAEHNPDWSAEFPMAATTRKDTRVAGPTPHSSGATASRHDRPERPTAPHEGPTRTRQQDTEEGIKTFVLDTNVLLHNPNALFVFKEHHVVIPFAVIEELDKLKRM